MKKILGIVALFVLALTCVANTYAVEGAIWTTKGDCGTEQQDVNHYAVGEHVFINGKNFAEVSKAWDITGQPGGASCDPKIHVANGSKKPNADGTFCFDAYTVAADDCGEYKVKYDNKQDNYRVDSEADTTCEEEGYTWAIAQYNCDEGDWPLFGTVRDGFLTSATGDGEDCSEVDWTSNPDAAGVLELNNQGFVNHPGFASAGSIENKHGINSIIICGDPLCGNGIVEGNEPCDDGNDVDDDACSNLCEPNQGNNVPEFGVVAAGLALAGAGAYIAKKRKK